MKFKEGLLRKRENYALLDNEGTVVGEVRNGTANDDGTKEMVFFIMEMS